MKYLGVVLLSLGMPACDGGDPPLTREQLLMPEACEECHPEHFRQWQGSSHAYAADDPVFVAMNARFQQDPGDESPDLCVRCHAPVAWALGETTDGLDLEEGPAHLRGVTCYICHAAKEVDMVEHSFSFVEDGTFLGGILDPSSTGAHESAYSTLLDRQEWQSATMCGACHDFSHRFGAHVHRTFAEWTDSMFNDSYSRLLLSCSGCHMEGTTAPVASDGPTRSYGFHDHQLVGVNVALEEWPDKESQRAAIERDLDPTVLARLCLTPEMRPQVILDNVMAGHSWPSGDSYTRRAWTEVIAYKDGAVIYESGVIADGQPVSEAMASDPALWFIGDQLLGADEEPVLFSWQAKSLVSTSLPYAVTADPSQPGFYHAVTREYPILDVQPDSMTLKVHIRPIGLEIVDALVDDNGLDPAVRDRIPTFTLDSAQIEWKGQRGTCVPPL